MEFSLSSFLVFSPTFFVLSVLRNFYAVCFASEFVFLCLYFKYLSVFPWSSHYHLLCCCHQHFSSCLFYEVFYSPKCLSVLNQYLCFFCLYLKLFSVFSS